MRVGWAIWICFMFFAALAGEPSQAAQSVRVSYENTPFNNQPTRKINGELKTPDGTGPFGAVLVLQACGGLDDNVSIDWPKYLNDLGYAAFIIDILGSRNVPSACDGNPIPLDERLRDVYGALAFLAQRPSIDPARIYAIGFSWGGTHVLEALLERRPGQFATTQKAVFKGGIAVYPGCEGIAGAVIQRNAQPVFYAPLLIVGAELDDWTPVANCKTVVSGQRQPGLARLEIMAGAHHGFDQFTNRGSPLSLRKVLGHSFLTAFSTFT